MATNNRFAIRSQKDIGVFNAPPTPASASACKIAGKPTETVKALSYSPDGRHLAWTTAADARIVDADTLQPVAVLSQSGLLSADFSPKGTYVVTWERYSKGTENETCRNLKVWETATGTLLGGFVQRSFSARALQWTDDEKYCAKLLGSEVRFFAPTDLIKPAHVLKLDGMSEFSVSPGLSPSVAVFVPERGAKPALVRMYAMGAFARPVANKTFFNADKVEFHWHHLGTSVLVLAQTEVDKSGRNYYGESSLYFMAAAGNFDCRVVLDRDGPIHDVAWSPGEKEFVVVYGYMPAKTALFNHRAEPVFDFGIAPRNFVRFNPHGRVIALAGFGNLSGTVELWDRKTNSKICSLDGHGASFCDWSPDGRYLMAATLSPRLRVDNGVRIWHYSGALVYRQDINELYQVCWCPASVINFPQRSALSPVPPGIAIAGDSKVTEKKPVTAYRPPHARKLDSMNGGGAAAPRSLSDIAEQRAFTGSIGTPGARIPVGASPRMVPGAIDKNNRRRVNNNTTAPAKSTANSSDLSSEIDVLKRIRALRKKANQIDGLLLKRDAGETLEANQLAKIETKAATDAEIAELSARLAQLGK